MAKERETRPFQTTRQLAELIERLGAAPRPKDASGHEGLSGLAHGGE